MHTPPPTAPHEQDANKHASDLARPLSGDLPTGNKMWIYILLGMVLGIATGLSLSPSGLGLVESSVALSIAPWVALPGTVFIRLLQMVVVPLVLCSIILGIASTGSLTYLRRMGLRILPYFVATTIIAISIGMVLTSVVKPGFMIDRQVVEKALADHEASGATAPQTLTNLTIPQRIANIIPSNPARAQLERDMLQIVILAIFIGICVITLPPQSTKGFIDLCSFGQLASMKIIGWAMAIAPIAVFGLLCDITIRVGFDIIASVAAYFLTVLGGLFVMGLVYLLIIYCVARRSPFDFLKAVREVQILAFSTSSSAAVMPLSLYAAEHKLKIEPQISRFVIPLGATINMDGTALYQAAAALFLCQIFGIELSQTAMVLLLLTTVGASIGTPAMPGVGIVVLATILAGIGVPLAGIALILGVDRLLDMVRTTINVTGDLTATCVMDRWMGGTFKAPETAQSPS